MSGARMPDEGFLRRWARLKSTGGDAAPADAPRAPAAPALAPAPLSPARSEAAPRAPLPTVDDVAGLTPDADFSAFVAQGVDKSVQRLALKKLFADPHFHVMDGLDMYMSDYNKASPLSPAMLASLKHAPGVLDRLFGEQQEGADKAAQAQLTDMQHGQPTEQEHTPEHERAPQSTQQGNA
ncbi:MAG: DUF3306 domain-containing protein [Lysobacteraceae bacterium]|nr:MAG: DUF3306 domain-containing protein [Xanthomonadaceae bacterium]